MKPLSPFECLKIGPIKSWFSNVCCAGRKWYVVMGLHDVYGPFNSLKKAIEWNKEQDIPFG